MTGEELAKALEERGVTTTGWSVHYVQPEGKERWGTQGFTLAGWTLTPGGKKKYINFGRGMEKGESWLTSADGLLSIFIADVDELAEVLLERAG